MKFRDKVRPASFTTAFLLPVGSGVSKCLGGKGQAGGVANVAEKDMASRQDP